MSSHTFAYYFMSNFCSLWDYASTEIFHLSSIIASIKLPHTSLNLPPWCHTSFIEHPKLLSLYTLYYSSSYKSSIKLFKIRFLQIKLFSFRMSKFFSCFSIGLVFEIYGFLVVQEVVIFLMVKKNIFCFHHLKCAPLNRKGQFR